MEGTSAENKIGMEKKTWREQAFIEQAWKEQSQK
jgi:hypothetical protein